MDLGGAVVHRPRPRRSFGYFPHRWESTSPPAGGEIPPAKRATQRPDEGIGPYKQPLYYRPLIRPSVRTGAPSPEGEGLGMRGETQFRTKFFCCFSFKKSRGRRPNGLRPNSYSRKTQHIFAPAGILSSIISRFRRSSPFSVWTAEMSMPLDSSPIIFRGGRLTMATRVLPTSSSGL